MTPENREPAGMGILKQSYMFFYQLSTRLKVEAQCTTI